MKTCSKRILFTAALALAGASLLGAAELSEADQARFRASVERMLDRGFKPGPQGLKAAEESYREAARLRPGDPRLEYAWGLVLLRQFRHRKATERLRLATELSGAPYWPAWQALVWCRLTAGDFEPGAESALGLAEHVSGDKSADEEAQRDAAVWLGRVIEGLEITTEPAARRERVAEINARILQLFGPELQKAYKSGKQQTRERRAALKQEIDAIREKAIKQNAQKNLAGQEQIQTALEELAEKKAATAQAAAESKEWFDERSREYDKQLVGLNKDREYLRRRAASVQQSLYGLAMEYAMRDLIRQNARVAGFDLLRLQQEMQWLGYEMESQATFRQWLAAERRAAAVLGRRRVAEAKHSAQARALKRQTQTLDRLAERLEQRSENLDEQPLDRSPELSVRMQRMRRLSAYVDLDLEAERFGILEAFGIL